MVENATHGLRRGRPPKFDPAQVIDAAIGAFLLNGFDTTTLTDLETATGVDRSTLYNSFGGKSGLYHRATQRYLDQAAEGLFGILHSGGDDGIEGVVEFLSRLRLELTSQTTSRGCLIVNDMAAGSDPDAARRYRELLYDGLRTALGRAADSGLIDPSTVDRRTAFVSAAVIGINLISCHTGDNDQVEQLLGCTITEVAAWRNDTN